jgi:hypothetical protein
MVPEFNSAEEMRLWATEQKRKRDRFEAVLPTLENEDGLVPTGELVMSPLGWKLRCDKELIVVPHWRVESVGKLLQQRVDLWPLASIRIQPGRSLVGRATVYGVPFSRAVQQAFREKLSKARFLIIDSIDESKGFPAQLFIRMVRLKQSNGPHLGVEAWEWIGKGVEVNYAHMILTLDGRIAVHVDGANIVFADETDVQAIFAAGEKGKGVAYDKYFRLDGKLAIDDAIQLVQEFFQVKELVGEYFECRPGWPKGLESEAEPGTASDSSDGD